MSSIAALFAQGLFELGSKPLPENVAAEAKRSLINVIGTSVGASKHPGVDAILATARELGVGELAGVPGRTERVDVHFSALATGFAGHLDDFDDTHLATVIHPAASILAVLTALADETSPSGEKALTAFALGCEAQLRVGVSISPEHYDRGWHITGTCGVIGCAVTAALLLGADEAELTRAISIAASMFVGQREAFGTMTKPFHPGKAAANGIAAARLAAHVVLGMQAADDIFEAPGGYSHSLSTKVDFSLMNDQMGDRWELLFNTYKPYPCGIVAHPAIDAGLALSTQLGTANALDVIAAVTLRCHPLVPELMGNPQPKDGLQARFSAIHGVAAALCDRQVGIAQYEDERVIQPDVRAIRALTTLQPDATVNRDEVFIQATLKDGTVLDHHVEHARGSLARPLTNDELTEKVRLLIDPILGDGKTAALFEEVNGLELAPNLDALFALCILTKDRIMHEAVAHSEVTDALATFALAPVSDSGEAALSQAQRALTAARSHETSSVAQAYATLLASQGAQSTRAGATSGDARVRAWALGATLAASDIPTPSTASLAVAITLGAQYSATDTEIASAAAVGAEAATRLLAAVDSDEFRQRWNVSSSIGILGAVLVASRLLGLDRSRTIHAVGLAATQAAGLAHNDRQAMAPIEVGKAAADAIEAALMAKHGFTSAAASIDGRRGLAALMAYRFDANSIIAALGEQWVSANER